MTTPVSSNTVYSAVEVLPLTTKIVIWPDKILREKSQPVTTFDQDLKDLVTRMMLAVEQAEGMGLAAVQLGVLKRVVVLHLPWQTKCQALINPSFAPIGEDKQTSIEGCLSYPGCHGKVERYINVHVTSQDVEGATVEFDADNLEARAIQHEVDHLEGVLFFDHLTPFGRSLLRHKYNNALKRRNRRDPNL